MKKGKDEELKDEKLKGQKIDSNSIDNQSDNSENKDVKKIVENGSEENKEPNQEIKQSHHKEYIHQPSQKEISKKLDKQETVLKIILTIVGLCLIVGFMLKDTKFAEGFYRINHKNSVHRKLGIDEEKEIKQRENELKESSDNVSEPKDLLEDFDKKADMQEEIRLKEELEKQKEELSKVQVVSTPKDFYTTHQYQNSYYEDIGETYPNFKIRNEKEIKNLYDVKGYKFIMHSKPNCMYCISTKERIEKVLQSKNSIEVISLTHSNDEKDIENPYDFEYVIDDSNDETLKFANYKDFSFIGVPHCYLLNPENEIILVTIGDLEYGDFESIKAIIENDKNTK